MNVVVAAIANEDQVFGFIFPALDVLFDVVKLEEPWVLSGPKITVPAADPTCVSVSLINKFLRLDGDVAVVGGGVRGDGLQDVLAGLEIGAAGESGGHRVAHLRADLASAAGPVLVFGHVEEFFGGDDFADVSLEILEEPGFGAGEVLALSDAVG